MMEQNGFIDTSTHLRHYDFSIYMSSNFTVPKPAPVSLLSLGAKSLPGLIAASLAPAQLLYEYFCLGGRDANKAEGKRSADVVNLTFMNLNSSLSPGGVSG